MTFLVDTIVIGKLVRRDANPGVLSRADSVSSVVISAVTVEEISFRVAWKPNQRIQEWIEQFFAGECRICPVTIEVARGSGAVLRRAGSRAHKRTRAHPNTVWRALRRWRGA